MIVAGYPGFLPGLLISIVVGTAFHRQVARRVGMPEAAAWMLIVSVGAILSATLPPGSEGASGIGTLGCDSTRVGPASLREYLRLGESGLNVLLFTPLGLAIAYVERTAVRALALLFAALLPIAIEAIQLVAQPLGRACQTADLFDNLAGLLLGFAVGLASIWIGRRGF